MKKSAAQESLPAGAPPAADSPTPPRVPDHTLTRLIGRGSYGEVWLAQSALGSWRAVKVVRRQSFDSDRPYEREFAGIQKFEPISRLHEGFVDILHVGRNDEEAFFYYVMELADATEAAGENGGKGERGASQVGSLFDAQNYRPKTLRSILFPSVEGSARSVPARHTDLPTGCPIRPKSSPAILRALRPETGSRSGGAPGRLPPAECLPIFLTLASALAQLHKQGLPHRDIKPANIIFVGGVAKLADIGLVADAGAARTFVGTEGFIPPEGPGPPQADLYALAKTFYEVSTGQDRLEFPSLPLARGQTQENRSLVELNAIFLKACALDPKRRYTSADQMQAELALLQSGKSVRRLRVIEQRLAQASRIGLLAAPLLWRN